MEINAGVIFINLHVIVTWRFLNVNVAGLIIFILFFLFFFLVWCFGLNYFIVWGVYE
jgi:hypothetical protein